MSTVSRARPDRDCAPRLVDIDAERASYRVAVPERFNAVVDIVDVWASEDPDALAVRSVDATGAIVADQSAADLARASREVGAGVVGSRGPQGRPRVRDAAADPGVVRGAARRDADRRDPDARAEPADRKGHRVPLRADRRDRGDHRRGGRREGRRAAVPGLQTRLCVGRGPDGWLSLAERCRAVGDGETPADPTSRDDPLLLYFTSGTVAYPEDGSARRSPTRSATSGPRASGTTCAPATCTGRSPTRAGPRRPGAGCSGRCTNARRSSTWRWARPTRTRSSASSPAMASRRSARRRRSIAGWSTRTSPSTTSRRCGTARAPASR